MSGKEVEKSESVMTLGLLDGKSIHLVFSDWRFVHWLNDADVILGKHIPAIGKFHEIV
ncbi:MAG: hypothetical protein H0X47_14715 [Nitrospirales bacterium]|nr:hypothetical protein [Nitrospirales bacterium]